LNVLQHWVYAALPPCHPNAELKKWRPAVQRP
jgi:hypothetical protein